MKVTLRYVIEDVDRYGNVRIYVRKPAQRKVRIREMPGTEAFMLAYHKAIAGNSFQIGNSSKPGSFGALCLAYYASREWKALDKATREWRRRYLDRVCGEHGADPVRLLDAQGVMAIMDDIGQPTLTRSSAGTKSELSHTRKVLRWRLRFTLVAHRSQTSHQ